MTAPDPRNPAANDETGTANAVDETVVAGSDVGNETPMEMKT